MDDVIEIIGEVADPVVDTIQDWGEDVVNHIKEHAHSICVMRYTLCVTSTLKQ